MEKGNGDDGGTLFVLLENGTNSFIDGLIGGRQVTKEDGQVRRDISLTLFNSFRV